MELRNTLRPRLSAMMTAYLTWLVSWLVFSHHAYAQIEPIDEEELRSVPTWTTAPVYRETGTMYDGSEYAQNIGT
jgi:hypothetical protein